VVVGKDEEEVRLAARGQGLRGGASDEIATCDVSMDQLSRQYRRGPAKANRDFCRSL
jgi:hypothetical protein